MLNNEIKYCEDVNIVDFRKKLWIRDIKNISSRYLLNQPLLKYVNYKRHERLLLFKLSALYICYLVNNQAYLIQEYQYQRLSKQFKDYFKIYISTDEIADFISDYLPNDIYDELEEKGYI